MTKTIKALLLLLVAALPFCLLTSCSDDDDELTSVSTGTINGHNYVDLGLSVKWATCNIGASIPSDYGDYFAWGETTTKSTYSETNSGTYMKTMGDISGNASYDAARANWGSTWRLPTKSEMDELMDRCKWEWTTQDGHSGYKVTGTKGNSIFLPAAGTYARTTLSGENGSGWYWTSTPDEDNLNIYAYELSFSKSEMWTSSWMRHMGLSIRPVSE